MRCWSQRASVGAVVPASAKSWKRAKTGPELLKCSTQSTQTEGFDVLMSAYLADMGIVDPHPQAAADKIVNNINIFSNQGNIPGCGKQPNFQGPGSSSAGQSAIQCLNNGAAYLF